MGFPREAVEVLQEYRSKLQNSRTDTEKEQMLSLGDAGAGVNTGANVGNNQNDAVGSSRDSQIEASAPAKLLSPSAIEDKTLSKAIVEYNLATITGSLRDIAASAKSAKAAVAASASSSASDSTPQTAVSAQDELIRKYDESIEEYLGSSLKRLQERDSVIGNFQTMNASASASAEAESVSSEMKQGEGDVEVSLPIGHYITGFVLYCTFIRTANLSVIN